MKLVNKLLTLVILLLIFNACKKGCTDPDAYNYNMNRTEDNGSCKYYQSVSLDSVRVYSFSELNNQNQGWDAGYSNDIDSNNTLPDLFLGFISPSNYVNNNLTYVYNDVNPLIVDYTFELMPKFTSSQWVNLGFWIYLYDLEYDNTYEPIDSVYLEPFDNYGSSRTERFKNSMTVSRGFNKLNLVAYFSWQ